MNPDMQVGGSPQLPPSDHLQIAAQKLVRAFGHLIRAGGENDLGDLVKILASHVGGDEKDPRLEAAIRQAIASEPAVDQAALGILRRGVRMPLASLQAQAAAADDVEPTLSRPTQPIAFSRTGLPGLVQELLNVESFKSDGQLVPGVFRESPLPSASTTFISVLTRQKSLMEALREAGPGVDASIAKSQLVKAYFRDHLPDSQKLRAPLEGLPRSAMGAVAAEAAAPTLEQIDRAKALVSGKTQIEALLKVLHQVCEEGQQHADRRAFSAAAIANSMGQNLFQPCSSKELRVAGEYSKKCADTLQFFLENYEAIFQ